MVNATTTAHAAAAAGDSLIVIQEAATERTVNNVFFAPTKAQLISKHPFGVFKSPKKPTRFFPGFVP